jgi:hypothetical protein
MAQVERGQLILLNPDEKCELNSLLRHQLRNVETDNWRDFEPIAERLRILMTRWRRERHSLGVQ